MGVTRLVFELKALKTKIKDVLMVMLLVWSQIFIDTIYYDIKWKRVAALIHQRGAELCEPP